MEEPRLAASADWLQPPVEQEGLTRYVATLRERIWLIAGVVAVATVVAILYVLTATKEYEAQSQLLVTPAPQQSSSIIQLPVIQPSADPTRDVQTASQLVSNRNVAVRVARELGNGADADALLAEVQAVPLANSSFIAVTATAADPAQARRIANSFALQAVVAETARVHRYVNETLPSLRAQLRSTPGDTGLQDAVTQLEAAAAAPDPTLQVQTLASTPTAPSSPKKTLAIAGGILGGLILGIVAAFALQVLDPRLRREEQLRRLYRIPILARIPKEPRGKNAVTTPIAPLALSPAASEAFRTLRGTLAVARRRRGDESRVVLVTGSSPSEGKTTTAINLASSLAAAGNSVILIEADLRRPSISRALGVNADRGIVSVLIESVELRNAVQTTPSLGPNLGLLLADYEGGWISELFSLPTARDLIEDARELADYVVIDSPPLTDVVDALPLASYVDDVLLVVRLGTTNLSKLTQLGELLAENGIPPSGFVLVGVQRPARRDYAYYGASARQIAGDGSEPLGSGVDVSSPLQ